MYTDNYVVQSLELHLFFGRIMKEHSLFLRAGFMPVDADCAQKAECYKEEFEELLCQALMIGEGLISEEVLCSGELVTEFTALAEKQTEKLTGIAINRDITAKELRLMGDYCRRGNMPVKLRQVKMLNQRALRLLNGLICFKESILENVLACQMFTANYPLLIEHITREAQLYRRYVQMLEENHDLSCMSMKDTECFWNRIMMEHALFMRGLLDPTEADLFCTADGFAREYAELLEACNCAQEKTMETDSLQETLRFRDFKKAGAEGIEQCKIRSIILPLLADHVLREANHYIRLLKS